MKTITFSRMAKWSSALALGTILAACGNQDNTAGDVEVNQTGWPIVNEEITLSMMAPGMGLADWADMPFFEYLNAETGINWTFTTPPSADFATNLNLSLAAMDLPDVIFGGNVEAAMQAEFGSEGVFIPLEELIENYAPNLYAMLEQNPDIRRSITAPDGHIYALPTFQRSTESYWPFGPAWFNGSFLDALDADVPTTLDEFTELMLRMANEEPAGPGVTVFPISDGNQLTWLRQLLLAPFGLTSRNLEEFDGVVQHNATSDNYRAYLEWMNMAMREGILHPEIFSLSNEANSALGQNNQVGLFTSWYSMFFLAQNEIEALNNPLFGPLTSEWAPEPVILRSPRVSVGTFIITSANPNPAATMRWVDFFFSEEGAYFSNFGPWGAFAEWATNDAGEEVLVYSDAVDLDDIGSFRGRVTPFWGFPAPGVQMDWTPVRHDPNDEMDTRFREFIASETARVFEAHGKVPMPPIMLLPEEADALSLITADLNTFLDQQEAAFITGNQALNDETWAQFQATLVQIGVEDMVEIWQTAYDRWVAAGE